MRRSLTFVLIAYASSWSYWLWMAATGRIASPGSTASHLPGLAGPALAALVTVALFDGRAGLARLARQSVTIPRKRRFAVAAILAPLVLGAATMAALPGSFPGLAALTAYPGVPSDLSPLAGLGLVFVLNGLGEELGWRGELLAQLTRRHGRLAATAIVALIWAGWHVPVFAVNASMQAMLGPALIGWGIGLVTGAFVLAEIRLATGSVLAAALFHTAINYTMATEASAGPPAAVVSTAIMAWGLWIAWRWGLRARRRWLARRRVTSPHG